MRAVTRTVRLLHLSRLREQPLRAALAVLAIAAGVALSVGVFIDQASANRTLSAFNRQRAGDATLKVVGPARGPTGLDQSVVDRVAAVDGVEAVIPLVDAVTVAEAAAGDERLIVAFGVDCSIERIVGQFGCDQAALADVDTANAPLMSPSLRRALGEDGVIRTNEGRIPVHRAITVPELERLNDGRVAVFALPAAQRLFGQPGTVGSALVVSEPDAVPGELRQRVERAAGEHNRVTDADADASVGIAGTILPWLYLTSLLSLALGGQLAYNTLTLTFEERRRDLAVAGALGATQRMLVAGTLAEAGLLGGIGGLLGVGGGIIIARPLVDNLSEVTSRFTGVTFDVWVPMTVVALGIGLGVGTGVLAAIGPARRAARADISAELQGQAHGHQVSAVGRAKRAVVYLVLGAVGILAAWVGQRGGAIEPWQPVVARVGFLTSSVVLFRAAAHAAAPVLAWAGHRLPRLQQGTVGVAMANLTGDAKRTGVMTLAVSVAVGMAVMLGSIDRTIVDASGDTAHRLASGALYTSTLPSNNTLAIAAKVSPETRQRLESFPGVAGVTESYNVALTHPSVGDVIVGTHRGRKAEIWPVHRGDSYDEVIGRGEVLVGPALARKFNLDPGDTFRLPGLTGMATLRVGAIWADPDSVGSSVSLSHEQFEAIWGRQVPFSLMLTPEPDLDAVALAQRIRSAQLDPDLVVLDSTELARDFSSDIRTFMAPFWALQRGMLLVAFIAIASTLLLVGVQRRREHGVLTAVGMAPAALGRMTLAEAGLVGVTGTVLGTVAGVGITAAFIFVSPVVTGLQGPFRFDPTAPFLYGGVATVAVLLAAALPAWRSARLDPAVALRYE